MLRVSRHTALEVVLDRHFSPLIVVSAALNLTVLNRQRPAFTSLHNVSGLNVFRAWTFAAPSEVALSTMRQRDVYFDLCVRAFAKRDTPTLDVVNRERKKRISG
jgi:hypothetical protein